MSYRIIPKLVGTINGAGDKGGAICGITLLDNKLSVLSYANELIKVYDLETPFDLKSQFKISGLQFPGDIITWKNELFVIDWTKKGIKQQVHIIGGDGNNVGKPWSIEDDFGCLSITKETTILETCHDQNALVEYNVDGDQIKKICLNPEQGFKHPHHAIKLDDTRFLICHGDQGDDLRRVCLVDNEGNLLNLFGSEKGSDWQHLNMPVYLHIDNSGSVFVLDHFTGRLCLLNSELIYKQDLVTRDSGLRYPMKMFYDEKKDLLYVADNDRIDNKMTDGRVLIFFLFIDMNQHRRIHLTDSIVKIHNRPLDSRCIIVPHRSQSFLEPSFHD